MMPPGARMKKTPSPRIRQVMMTIVLVLLGWFSIKYSRQYNFMLPSSPVFKIAGGLFLLVGVVMRILAFKELWCTYRIDHLVTSGIYAKTRNPIYLAFILIIFGLAFLSRRLLAFLWFAASVLIFWWAAKKEESDLERTFGEEYQRYREQVPILLPKPWK
jgi:protein-S-isoprenylcysteine O-methyltransferase Ste14